MIKDIYIHVATSYYTLLPFTFYHYDLMYFRIEDRMVEELKLSWNELLVYGVIHSSINQTYTFGQIALAKSIWSGIATTKRCLKNLIWNGLVEKVSKWYQTVSKWYEKVSKWYFEEKQEKYQNDTWKYQIDTQKYQNDTQTINNINNNIIKKEIIKEKRFEEFWNNYPLKKWKAKARERYIQAIKQWVSEDLLVQKAKEYAEEVKIKNTESKYIKRAEWWLNSGRYEDTYLTAKPQTKSEDKPYDFLKPTLSKPKLPWITNLKKDY